MEVRYAHYGFEKSTHWKKNQIPWRKGVALKHPWHVAFIRERCNPSDSIYLRNLNPQRLEKCREPESAPAGTLGSGEVGVDEV